MARSRLTRAVGDYVRGFASEDSVHYRTESQNLAPAIARARRIQHAQEAAGKAGNPYDRRYVGSVPITVVTDWCKRHGYTFDQWARNEGGTPGKYYPESQGGVKDEFMRYFLSRDFAKLHTQHVTTKKESSQILVPRNLKE